jgi:hypothetical protein
MARAAGRYPDSNLPVGFFADVAVRGTDTLNVVGEIGRSSRSVTEFGVPVTLSVTTYQAGVRAIGRMPGLAVFGQSLVGLAQFAGSAAVPGFNVSTSMNAVALQVGGGIIVPITPRVGVRTGIDYRYAVATSVDTLATARQWRLGGGVTFALGGQ